MKTMFDLKRKLMAVTIGCLLFGGAFGQKPDNRPPKDNNKIIVKDKQPRPPQNNNTQQPKNEDKKGKPSN